MSSGLAASPPTRSDLRALSPPRCAPPGRWGPHRPAPRVAETARGGRPATTTPSPASPARRRPSADRARGGLGQQRRGERFARPGRRGRERPPGPRRGACRDRAIRRAHGRVTRRPAVDSRPRPGASPDQRAGRTGLPAGSPAPQRPGGDVLWGTPSHHARRSSRPPATDQAHPRAGRDDRAGVACDGQCQRGRPAGRML